MAWGVSVLLAASCGGKLSEGDGGSSDGSKPPLWDGPLVDDGPVTPKPDAPVGCSSGLACEFCDVSGYSPIQMSPPLSQPGACSANDISTFVAACVSTSATQLTCNQWQTQQADAGTGCLDCVFTLQSAAQWGVLICTSVMCSFNVPGCIDLELGQVGNEKSSGGAGSCGDLVNADYGCVDYACSTCSAAGNPGSTDFDVCSQSAEAGECWAYHSPTTSTTGPCAALAGDASPAAEKCMAQPDFSALMNVFCGIGP